MPQRDECVLVIDDEPIQAQVMSRILETSGFTVLVGNNYEDALRIFDSKDARIDLLVVDISLPGRSGVEIAAQLLNRKRDLKVLFVSGYVGAEVIRFHGMSTSDVHFLRKPFQAEEFLERVERVLESTEPMQWSNPRLSGRHTNQESHDGDT